MPLHIPRNSAIEIVAIVTLTHLIGCDAATPSDRCPAVLGPESSQQDISVCASYFVDASEQMTYEEAKRHTPEFQPVPSTHKSFGPPLKVRWLHFIAKSTDNSAKYILDLNHPRPAQVDLYAELPLGLVHHSGGYNRPPYEQTSEGTRVHLPLPIESTPTSYWVRIKSNSVSLPISEQATFQKNEQRRDLIAGAYFGLVIIMVAYNSFLWFGLADASYAFYVLHILCVAMYQAGRMGYLNYYIVPASKTIGFTGGASVAVGMAVASLFCRRFLGTQAHWPIADRTLTVFATICFLVGLSGLMGLHAFSTVLIPFLVVAGAILIQGVATVMALSKQKPNPAARYFAVAWGVFNLACIFHALWFIGWLSLSTPTSDFLTASCGFEAMVLSLGLAHKIRELTAAREASASLAQKMEALALAERLARADQERNIAQQTLARELSAREEERARVARELHDGIGHSLLVIKKNLEGISQHSPHDPKPSPSLDQVIHITDQTIDDTRRVAYDLHPSTLAQLGLGVAVSSLAVQLCKNEARVIETAVTIEAEKRLGTNAIHIYRIVQEALSNAIRHGHAMYISIDVECTDASLSCTIADNGRGFDQGNLSESERPRLGISAMSERARALCGTFSIDSAPGQGCVVHVTVPLPSSNFASL